MIFPLTSVTKTRSTRKLDTQMKRTKILCLTDARNIFGNKSVTVVIKLSTITNWGQKEIKYQFNLCLKHITYLQIHNMTGVTTCESIASRHSIKKKQAVQNCGKGIIAVA